MKDKFFLANKDTALIAQIKMVLWDFDGVFTDNTVWVCEDGKESVRCCRSDGIGLKRLNNIGVKSMVLSTENNPVVSVRTLKLGVSCIQACVNKKEECLRLSVLHGIELSKIAFVGNDINDLEALRAVGFPIAVRDSYPEILAVARYVTRRKGGRGAVREVCDWIVGIFLKESCQNNER